jgi:thiamine-monophosphate kinase
MHEFDLIREYFTKPTQHTDLSVGDDAALLSISAGMQLAVSTDMLVEGRHFFKDADPYLIGWKAMAVNVSDMTAMAALPKWATLSIALPHINTDWLSQLSAGFFACAKRFNIDLIGGDTTRGPLTISVQIMGEVETGKALTRAGAQLGDTIWVSGNLGQAALALAHLQGQLTCPNTALEAHLLALHQPQPSVILGLGLQGIATSAIDISDGLLSEIGHILNASMRKQSTELGAEIWLHHIPTSNYITSQMQQSTFQQFVLAGGDDYQLCFTAPPEKTSEIHCLSQTLSMPLTNIGYLTDSGKVVVLDHNNEHINITSKGFNHFDTEP